MSFAATKKVSVSARLPRYDCRSLPSTSPPGSRALTLTRTAFADVNCEQMYRGINYRAPRLLSPTKTFPRVTELRISCNYTTSLLRSRVCQLLVGKLVQLEPAAVTAGRVRTGNGLQAAVRRELQKSEALVRNVTGEQGTACACVFATRSSRDKLYCEHRCVHSQSYELDFNAEQIF